MSPNTHLQLTKVDPDRMRAAGFANERLRRKLELLYAFHYELAKVPEIVSEPMIGQIRYQWWRDAIAEIYEGRKVRVHEISTPLSTLFLDAKMPRFWVDRLIDARERDLDPTPFPDLNAAKEYCAQTSGLLMQMAVHICKADIPSNTRDFDALNMDNVLQAGKAWGLTGLARSWRFYHQSMLSALEFNALCTVTREAYEQARLAFGTLPAQIIPALSYVALTPQYLKRMSSSRHNCEDMMPSYAPPLKTLRLMKVSMTGKI